MNREREGTRATRNENTYLRKMELKRKRKSETNLSETKKNQHNFKAILLHSNSNPIRNKDTLGYGCQFCSEQFAAPKHLKDHFLNNHKIQELLKIINGRLFEYFIKLDITDLKCTLCHKDISKLDEFMEHIKTEHNVEVYKDVKSAIVPFKFETKELRCAICLTEFMSFKHLLEHMNSHFANYICPVCGRGFVTDRLLGRHVKRHNNEELKCKDCDKVCGTKEKLREHQKRVHLGFIKRNKCMICDKRFLDYWQKVNHMVREHGAPQVLVKCQLCERTFKDQRMLTIHTKKDHLLERKHKCEECEMLFFSSTRLKHHMAKHTGLRQFQCDVCLKAYARKSTLREHMRIHANDRRFGCENCGKAFVQKCSLRSHMRSKHGNAM